MKMVAGEQYVCRCGATITFQPPVTTCSNCGIEYTNWHLAARLPRGRYRVEATSDGWEVWMPDEGGAFT